MAELGFFSNLTFCEKNPDVPQIPSAEIWIWCDMFCDNTVQILLT